MMFYFYFSFLCIFSLVRNVTLLLFYIIIDFVLFFTMSSKEYGSKTSAPRTPTSEDNVSLDEALDDMDLYGDDDDDDASPSTRGGSSSIPSFSLSSAMMSSSSSPEQTSPLAINLVGMSKTMDVEVSPFPTLAAREEEDAMGGDVAVVFTLPSGRDIENSFGIGQTIQMLKGWLEKEHEIPYVDQTLVMRSSGAVMIDPLSLNDFPEVRVGSTLQIEVKLPGNNDSSSYGTKTSSERK